MDLQEKIYIEKALGISVQYHHWKGELELPYYITERYDMRLVELARIRCIFLWPREKLNQIGSLKKQIRRIQMEEALPVVFVFKTMDRYHRQAFIAAQIPFVVADNQMYLPFMGMYLQEKYITEMKACYTLQPFTQLLLFYWYYRQKKCIYMNEAVKALGCSAMTVTRSFRQLEQTGMFETGKNGVQKYLEGKEAPDVVLENLEDQLSSPVSEIIYLNEAELKKQIPSEQRFVSGSSALVRMGIETEEKISCYAVNKKSFPLSGSRELLDATLQAKVELWKYDPSILDESGLVDPLSLALCLNRPLMQFVRNIPKSKHEFQKND
ncbi:hypothetical protein [Blautia sp. MSJ-19]|uniref:hypothetical protein n=1 Tax=Blautia sp. MSJ-19 TaxID=2841517 RepID=UPI001C0ECDA4|nr:hypothetical protein [Blautia sp. MSJ-19]MBU5481754.1 hypothetical protein [Blautia sp. MSJ-19]